MTLGVTMHLSFFMGFKLTSNFPLNLLILFGVQLPCNINLRPQWGLLWGLLCHYLKT